MQSFATPQITFTVTDGRSADMPDQRLRQMAAYWFARCGADGAIGGIVPRSAIDPLDFPALLPNIMLIERVGLPPQDRYRFRLAGTEVVSMAGRELTGRYIDEFLPGPYHDFILLVNRTALEKRQPVYTCSLYHDQGNFVNGVTYRLVMPIASQPETPPDMLFVAQFWQRRDDSYGKWAGDWSTAKPQIKLIAADPA